MVNALISPKDTTSTIKLENAKHSSIAAVKETKTISGPNVLANMLVWGKKITAEIIIKVAARF